jgi:hypothetical protein
MHESIALEIRSKVADWLAGACTIDQLKDWIVGVSWNIEETGDAEAIGAAYDVVHALALYDDDRDLERLCTRLQSPATSNTHPVPLR